MATPRMNRYVKIPRRLALLFCLATACSHSALAGEGHIVRTNPETYTVRFGFTVAKGKSLPSSMHFILPLAESDAYQDIERAGSLPGEVMTIDEGGDKYVRARLSKEDLSGGEKSVEYEFEATLYDVRVDFSQIRAGDSYRKDQTYQLYTSNSKDYIVPDNMTVINIARNIGNEARDNMDFARRAYEYVAKNYRPIPDRNILPLEKVLAAGGGSSCNLCSIYISILRRRGIPARHAAGYMPDGGLRFIAEFFVENYGWIPVDIVGRCLNPDDDFFGVIPRQLMPIFFSRGLNLPVEGASGTDRVPTLAAGVVWWQPRKAEPKVELTFTCEKVMDTF